MNHILGLRILWGTYDLTGTVPEIMRHLVDDCCIHPTRGDAEDRIIPGLSLEKNPPTSDYPVIHFYKKGGVLLDVLEDLKRVYHFDFGIGNNMEFFVRPMRWECA